MQSNAEPSMAGPLVMINPAGLYNPAANGYSHIAAVTPGARMIFVSGQGGENEHGELQQNFELQVRKAINNLGIALSAAGATMADVAKLTVLVVDHSEERRRVIGAEFELAWGCVPKPACTLIPVPRLALEGMLFEIDATAVLPI